VEETTSCLLGCTVSAGTGRCRHVHPTNVVVRGKIIAGTAEAVVPAGDTWTIDTTTGQIFDDAGAIIRPAGEGVLMGIDFSEQPQGGMFPVLGIFAFGSLTVESGATIRTAGAQALVLLSAGPVRIDGTIDLSASGRSAGSGGGAGGEARLPGFGQGGGAAGRMGGIAMVEQSGGGGGGHADVGGNGGDDFGTTGGTGGAAIPDPDGEPLSGGGGGGGGAQSGTGGPGGGGGGALQITSDVSITIGATAFLRVNGAGGSAGDQGGGGGGAGGTIFLEAPSITTRGTLVANGGGGAGGDASAVLDADDGEDGRDDTMAAAGGMGVDVGIGGRGGNGGAGGSIAGESAPDSMGAGGGGGGASGRLRFVTLGSTLVLMGVTSPTSSSARTMDTTLTTW
jgi:hypothetical protein